MENEKQISLCLLLLISAVALTVLNILYGVMK